ncbi:flavin-binding monooxygenase [Aspergillus bombycis]|uniref:Flavin-binding monooxygenase n=1 Tax=Aspergillus bombycis TaxID=109264 RepID=A0A1F7ZZ67_9EURO|nr:flavin-binding monooxygenase [Aspergillus bombycis]OGM44741.1 flavin-binding monooxygenase [Aspergillus bombycis]
MSHNNQEKKPYDHDLIIIGAGISGINTAYRVQQELPNFSYAILEARDTLGGTWDLFRYPGIRSDSDLFTFGFSWYPWTASSQIAEGSAIREYMQQAAASYGIDKAMKYNHRVDAAAWSTPDQLWTLDITHNGNTKTLRARFLVFGTGYYDYHQPLPTSIPGLTSFRGLTIHPQFWPEGCDYDAKRVVVIGSGATAITLLPKLSETAAKVTMLQRSPSYIMSIPSQTNRTWLTRLLPTSTSLKLNRVLKIVLSRLFFLFCRSFPATARWVLQRRTLQQLPEGIPHDPHFKPRYNPWDQRLCICPDGDFYKSLHTGRADIKTDTIKLVTESGIQLGSGEFLDADIIITATGLKLQIGAGIDIAIDGQPYKIPEKFLWHGILLEDLPNAALVIGYANISWTLGADVTGRILCRLLKHMERGGFGAVIPRVQSGLALQRGRLLNLSSTYVTEAEKDLPKVGDIGPWKARSNYLSDLIFAKYGKVNESLEFVRKSVCDIESDCT